MGVTNFPNGVSVGDGAGGTNYSAVVNYGNTGGQVKIVAGTITVPVGSGGTSFATGLTTVAQFLPSLYTFPVAGCAGVGGSVVSGGSVNIFGVSGAGTASTTQGTATWFAIGT